MANTDLQVHTNNVVVPQKTYDEIGNPIIKTPGGNAITIYTNPFNGRIVQPGSLKNNKDLAPHVRKFYFNDLDISVDHLELIPILFKGITRTMFPKFETTDAAQEPLCRSSDGFTPDLRVENPLSMHCARVNENGKLEILCEHAKWEGSKPANCQMSKIWIFYEINLNIPFYWQLKSTSLSAFNKAERNRSKQIDINKFKGISSANDILYVTLKDEGTYVVPEFSYVNQPSVQDLLGVVTYYRQEFSNEDEESVETNNVSTTQSLPEAPDINDSGVEEPIVEIDAKESKSVADPASAKKGKASVEVDKNSGETLDSSFASDDNTPF